MRSVWRLPLRAAHAFARRGAVSDAARRKAGTLWAFFASLCGPQLPFGLEVKGQIAEQYEWISYPDAHIRLRVNSEDDVKTDHQDPSGTQRETATPSTT